MEDDKAISEYGYWVKDLREREQELKEKLDKTVVDMNKKIEPIHPGEILLEEFLIPMEISQYRLAKDINVSPRRINEIVLGKRTITADTALRLSEYFRLSEKFWLNLQMKYNLEIEKDRLKDRLKKEVKRREKVI